MKQRIAYIDFLKSVAIFFVLLGHSTEQISADVFWDHPLWSFIYSFHMPLFMFLSGFFFKSALEKPFWEMLGGKLRRLGIPSLTAYAICVIIMLSAGTKSIFDLCDLSFSGFMNSVWFLKCVLFCYIIMYLMCKMIKNDIISAVLASVIIIFIPGTQTVNLNFMLPMFCIGMLCGNHLEWLEKHRRSLTIISLSSFIAMLFFWSGRMTVYMVPTQVINLDNLTLDVHNLGLTIYRLAIGMAGSFTFFFFAKPLYSGLSRYKICDSFCKIGSATLGIYFLQTFLLEIFIHSLHIYILMPWSCLAAPVIAVVELIVCYELVLLISGTRVLKLLVLGYER